MQGGNSIFQMFSDYSILVNKTNLLPRDYRPNDLRIADIPFAPQTAHFKKFLRKRAARAAKHLFDAGKSQNIFLYGVSGFRSYERQNELFRESLAKSGIEHTNKYLAPPGGSEHQSGLSLDVSIASLDYDLIPEFGQTKEGLWLCKYAPLYGFIIRYPKEKEDITMFAYEPWHIRYVTQPLAFYLSKTHLTLEEYHKLA